ncbi:hypothetical protein [Streptomyces sp. WZ-12]|uniref:hypothetical protein n=1 Tax=Streptomyces sp. WZ-12 TaxID=3030210 RepID=UPI0023812543|nr:hypothetical protein [Streptomyces sp. WZ-12]
MRPFPLGSRLITAREGHVLPHRAGEVEAGPAEVSVLCGDGRRLRLEDVEIDGRRGAPCDFPHVLHYSVVLTQLEGHQ